LIETTICFVVAGDIASDANFLAVTDGCDTSGGDTSGGDCIYYTCIILCGISLRGHAILFRYVGGTNSLRVEGSPALHTTDVDSNLLPFGGSPAPHTALEGTRHHSACRVACAFLVYF
jgi:hypothetical protein